MNEDFRAFLTSKFDLQIDEAATIDSSLKLPKAYKRLYEVELARIGSLEVYCVTPKSKTFSNDDCEMLTSLAAHLYPTKICLCSHTITDKAKFSLVTKRINYLALNSDIYLPDLLCMYEKSKLKDKYSPSSAKVLTEKLSPLSTKIAILYMQRIIDSSFTAKMIQLHTQASLPAITTATNSLIERDLLSAKKVGKAWQYTFGVTIKEIWSLRNTLFSDLIRSRKVVNVKEKFFNDSPLTLSGESAVAHYSLLSEPTTPIYCLDTKRVKQFETNYKDNSSSKSIILEVFYYHPLSKTISSLQVIDRMELIISKSTGLAPRVAASYEDIEDEVLEKLNSYG
ncbi:TPA: hypothetical protein I7750_19650 [Vibrio vulnificus]|nr:hypothetical protein [Vibrio vulnificus]HAS8519825.1 hypothetical protein [Vibrio vulnificus]